MHENDPSDYLKSAGGENWSIWQLKSPNNIPIRWLACSSCLARQRHSLVTRTIFGITTWDPLKTFIQQPYIIPRNP